MIVFVCDREELVINTEKEMENKSAEITIFFLNLKCKVASFKNSLRKYCVRKFDLGNWGRLCNVIGIV